MTALESLRRETEERAESVRKLKEELSGVCVSLEKEESAKIQIVNNVKSRCEKCKEEMEYLQAGNINARKTFATLQNAVEFVHNTTTEIQFNFGMEPPKSVEGNPNLLERLGRTLLILIWIILFELCEELLKVFYHLAPFRIRVVGASSRGYFNIFL
jgi:hypothetical protein